MNIEVDTVEEAEKLAENIGQTIEIEYPEAEIYTTDVSLIPYN
jgi:hypothetical protein